MGVGGQRHAPAALPPSDRPSTHCNSLYWATRKEMECYIAILLLYHFKAHTLPYTVRFQTSGPSILYTRLQPGRQRFNTFPEEVKRNSGKSNLNL